jgi:molybdate transport system substrate-binding protein
VAAHAPGRTRVGIDTRALAAAVHRAGAWRFGRGERTGVRAGVSRLLLRVLIALGMLSAAGPAVRAADVRVLAPAALRAPLVESARSFARSSGHRLEFIFASLGAVHKRIATGEHADVVIGGAEGTEALVKLGRGIEGSRMLLVRSALALVVRSAAGEVGVDDAGAVAAALQGARTLAMPDASLGSPGGAQAAELLEQLGLTEALRERTRRVADAREVARRVAAGTSDIGIGAMSDLVGASGVRVIGPIIEPRTRGIVYAAVVARASAQPEVARAFIAHLETPSAQAILRQAGFLPVN